MKKKKQHKEMLSAHHSLLKRHPSVYMRRPFVACLKSKRGNQFRFISSYFEGGNPAHIDGFLAKVRVHTESTLGFFLKKREAAQERREGRSADPLPLAGRSLTLRAHRTPRPGGR